MKNEKLNITDREFENVTSSMPYEFYTLSDPFLKRLNEKTWK